MIHDARFDRMIVCVLTQALKELYLLQKDSLMQQILQPREVNVDRVNSTVQWS